MTRKTGSIDKRIRIMEALSLCLQEKPFSRTTVKDIARTAGVNHGLVHYYFQSKEDLLAQYIDHVILHYQTIFETWLGETKRLELGSRETVEAFFDSASNQVTLNRQLSMVFIEIWAIGIYNPVVREKIREAYMTWIRMLTEIIGPNPGGSDASGRIALSIIAFLEGISLFSIVMDQEDFDIQMVLSDFRRRIIESL